MESIIKLLAALDDPYLKCFTIRAAEENFKTNATGAKPFSYGGDQAL